MGKVYDAVAICGEYQSGGETKRRYVNVGAVFKNDDGAMWMTLDSVPLHPDWNGKLQFFEPKARGTRRDSGVDAPSPRPEQPASSSARSAVDEDFQDDIPF